MLASAVVAGAGAPEADPRRREARGVAQDTIGTLAVAVGREAFEPYHANCMRIAIEATALKSPGLRECSFTFFTVVSRVYKTDMAPYLHTIMPLLIACVTQDDGLNGGFDPSANGVVANGTTVNGDDGFEDIDDVEISSDDAFGSSALMLEQEVAVQALGELFENVGEAFVPWLETCVKAIDICLEHMYEGGRKAAVQAFATYVRTAFALSRAEKPARGSISPPALPADVARLAQHVIGEVVKVFPAEDETCVGAIGFFA